MGQQAFFSHDPVDRRFRADIDAILGQDGNNLRGCEISETRFSDRDQHALTLLRAEPVHHLTGGTPAPLTAESLGPHHQAPAPEGARSNAE